MINARGPQRTTAPQFQQPVQYRQQERHRLAAAGHGAGEHVASRHRGGNGVGLDRRRSREAELLDALQQILMQLEFAK
jgi:hypothetical protein